MIGYCEDDNTCLFITGFLRLESSFLGTTEHDLTAFFLVLTEICPHKLCFRYFLVLKVNHFCNFLLRSYPDKSSPVHTDTYEFQ